MCHTSEVGVHQARKTEQIRDWCVGFYFLNPDSCLLWWLISEDEFSFQQRGFILFKGHIPVSSGHPGGVTSCLLTRKWAPIHSLVSWLLYHIRVQSPCAEYKTWNNNVSFVVVKTSSFVQDSFENWVDNNGLTLTWGWQWVMTSLEWVG